LRAEVCTGDADPPDPWRNEAALAAFDEVAPTAMDDGDVIEQYRWALLTAGDHGLDEVYPG